MEQVIRLLNELVQKAVIKDYAIGGATALIYYSAPTFTEDIDVFVQIEVGPKKLIDLSPIYDYVVKTTVAKPEGQYLMVHDFPLQFLIPYDPLSQEALDQAVPVVMNGVSFRIFRLEHLMAIMIQLRKDKYRERLRILLKERSYDATFLDALLRKFELTGAWAVLKKQLEGSL